MGIYFGYRNLDLAGSTDNTTLTRFGNTSTLERALTKKFNNHARHLLMQGVRIKHFYIDKILYDRIMEKHNTYGFNVMTSYGEFPVKPKVGIGIWRNN